MSDDRPGPAAPTTDAGERSRRIREAFDELEAALGERGTPEARATVGKLRSAILSGDAALVRDQMSDVKARHGWLHAELSLHPRIAELVNELALLGL